MAGAASALVEDRPRGLKITILGPLRAEVDGRPVSLSARTLQGILLRLLVEPGAPVTVAHLAEAVWGEDLPDGYQKTLGVHISRLRRALGREMVRHDDGRYRLAVDPSEVDSVQLEDLASQGRAALELGNPTVALRQLERALALVNGDPAGLGFDDPATFAEGRRLAELVLAVQEDRFEAGLALGSHAALIPELERFTTLEPLRERAQHQLMVALHRSGRSAEAVRAYHAYRSRLVHDLGLEPGRALAELERQILERDPAVDWRPTAGPRHAPLDAVPEPLAADDHPLIGRDRELGLLRDGLQQAVGGSFRLVTVAGEAGMGKSRLLAEIAREAAGEALVALGRCEPVPSIAYRPLVEVVRRLVDAVPTEELRVHLLGIGGDLVRIVPELAHRIPDLEPAPPREPEAQRYYLFEAVTSLISNLSRTTPLVLVFDDLQWGDRSTTAALRTLARSLDGRRVLLLLAFRRSEVGDDHPLHDVLLLRSGLPAFSSVDLEGVDEAAVASIAAGMAPGLACDAQLLRARSGGNPFFVRELVQHAIDSGRGLDDASVPTGVSALIDQRVDRLGPEARWFLTCAAVAGPVSDIEVLTRASGLPRDVVDDLVERSLGAGILAPVGPLAVEFAHALIPQALQDNLGERQAGQLHRRIAEAIEMTGAQQLVADRRVEDLAYHWARASTTDDLGRSVGYARDAGRRAMDQLAPAEACTWYQQGLAMLAEDAQRAELLRCSLLVGLGVAQRNSGDAVYRDTLLAAGRLADALHDRDNLVAAALANTRGFHSMSGLVDEDRIEVLEAACRVVGPEDSPERAMLLALHALELSWHQDRDEREALAHEALEIAERLGDPATLVGVITTRFVAIHQPETLAERYRSSRLALDLARKLEDPVQCLWAACEVAVCAVQAVDRAAAEEALELHVQLAAKLEQPMLAWAALHARAEWALVRGDPETGERLATEAFDLGHTTGQPDAFAIWANQIAEARYLQGRNEEIVEVFEEVVESNPGVAAFRTALAGCYCDLDRRDDARRLLADDLASDFASVGRDVAWLAGMLSAADAVYGIGDRAGAAVLYERLAPFEDQYEFVGVSSAGSVALRLARLAAVLDRFDAAEAHFAAATRACEELGACHELARLQLDHGQMLQRQHGTADVRARTLLESAQHTADERGYGLVATRAHRALTST